MITFLERFMLDRISIKDIINIAQEAGLAILEIYRQDFDVEFKEDDSPLTLADQKSNHIIISKLLELYPDIPYISEETKQTPYEKRKAWEYFWLIDPLDGTKEFIKKNGEFTVNIALIHKSEPILGVVLAPVIDKIFYAVKGAGSYIIENDIKVKWLLRKN